MTISKYISEFIKQYSDIVIDTNHVHDGSDQYGLFKSATRQVARNIDGSMKITEYYQFLATQDSVSESERKEADEWLEDLCYWVDDYPYKHDEYPSLDGSRLVTNIEISGSPIPYTDIDETITYQLTLLITYERDVNNE